MTEPAGKNQELVHAHPQDSLAFAQDLRPADLEEALAVLSTGTTNYQRLQRASLCGELAIATPEREGDAELFDQALADLKHILADETLDERHMLRFKAEMQLRYLPVFRWTANHKKPSEGLRRHLQEEMGHYMLRFLGEKALTSVHFGQLCEPMAIFALLDSKHFPHLASLREEENIYAKDNHDIYTIHQHGDRVKKAPGSIKYREKVRSDIVVGLTVGRMARLMASTVYNDPDLSRSNERTHAKATRLVADIMICKALGEKLDADEEQVLQGMIAALAERMENFAKRSSVPDYASNAEIIEGIIMEQAQQQRMNEQLDAQH